MPEIKQGMKPWKDGGKALPAEEAEGRDLEIYTCWKCGSHLYVPANWVYFVCWKDEAVNYNS